MANLEQCEILKKGVRAWNEWREDNPMALVDLSEANFFNTDLRGGNFNGANLTNANLSSANLSSVKLSSAKLLGANLIGSELIGTELIDSDLSRADLSSARLMEANLNGATLFNAELIGANCSEARFIGANLTRANLNGATLINTELVATNFTAAILTLANFDQALVGSTLFADVDFSMSSGLQSVEHRGPSTIGIDTFFRSKGKIPETFLRGAGVPDIFIEYAASLSGKPIDFYSCFISYSVKDTKFAERLYADLQSRGVRCWFAPEDLKIGDKFRVRIDESIRVYDKLLLVLSSNSVQSEWVEKEVETAMEREREQKRSMLFPIRLDESVMEIKNGWPADIRRSRHIGDFCNWKSHDQYQMAFERLLRDLKA